MQYIAVFLFFVICNVSCGRVVYPIGPTTIADAIIDANIIASKHPDSLVIRVNDSNMYPFFGTGSLLVVTPIEYARIRLGMLVTYNDGHNLSTKRIVSKNGENWVAQTYRGADNTIITTRNLVGVVYSIIHTNGQ